MQPLDRMWGRVEIARGDSDTSLFYDLLYLGELLTKLVVAGLTAAVAEDRERQRYAIEYQLVRANSIGDWAQALDELLVGPPSQLTVDGATVHKRELTQRWATDESWQRSAVEQLHQVCKCLDASFDALPAKVPLQRWFQWFAWLRNRTRGHGAPTGQTCGDVAPVLEVSMRLISRELSLFQEPWAVLRRNLTGKYRVVMMSGAPEPFEYLKRETDHAVPDGVYIAFSGEICPVPFIYTDVDLSDFYIANGNFKPSGFETLSYVTDDVRPIDATPYQLPASALPMSGTAAGPTLDVRDNCFTNVPPPIDGYISRPGLEQTLRALLLDDRHPVVTLVGRGGVGKTSLALEVLDQVMKSDEYFAIPWFSARDIDLLPQGPKRVQADVLTQADIAAQFVALMNPAGSASKAFDTEAYLGACMSGQSDDGPFLFVFDNFETIRNPLDLFSVIDTYIRPPNKVLITSRFRNFKGDYPVEVGGMTRDEFDQLAMTTAVRLGITDAMTEGFLTDLFDESDGHPYVVRILLGEVARRGRVKSFERVMAARDDILDALFERTFASLPPAEQRVFLTVCGWRSIVPRLAIEAALLRPVNERMDVEGALQTLEQSSLIEIVGGQDPADEFVRVPLAASVFGRRKLTVSPMKTAIDADTQVIQLFGAAQLHEAGRGIAPRVDRVIATLALKLQRGEDISADLPVIEFIARRHPPTWLRLADLFEEDGEGDTGSGRAANALTRYLEARPDDIDAWRRLAGSYGRLDDAQGELHARLQIAEQSNAALSDVSHLANRFNSLVAKGTLSLPTDERRAIAERVRLLLESHLTDDVDATTLSRLAWVCLHLGDTSAARDYATRGLSQEPHNRYCAGLMERLGEG